MIYSSGQIILQNRGERSSCYCSVKREQVRCGSRTECVTAKPSYPQTLGKKAALIRAITKNVARGKIFIPVLNWKKPVMATAHHWTVQKAQGRGHLALPGTH